jgi:CubicO group peptidase (beta-lactamase class C family)
MSDDSVIEIRGEATGGFEALHDVFARMIAVQEIGGAAFSVYHDGRKVVDLTGGEYADDSLQLVYSVSKAITSTAVGVAVQDGLIDIDAPLSDCWPEFGKPSTAAVTLRMVMSHRAGLYAFREPLTWDELLHGGDQEQIARIEPWWEPGTNHGYHAFSYGSVVNGVFHRVLGRSVGDFVRERLAEPLGLDLWIGTPKEQLRRTTPTLRRPTKITDTEAARRAKGGMAPDVIGGAIAELDKGMDDERFLGACFPAASGVADARSLARLLAATGGEVDGVRLWSPETQKDFAAERSYGIDFNLGVVTAFGTGLELPFPQLPYSGESAYGHEAAGGSYAFHDPELGISVGYTTNVFPHMHGSSIAGVALMAAVRHCAARVA